MFAFGLPRWTQHSLRPICALAMLALASGAALAAEDEATQATYDTPQAAVDALIAAVKSGETEEIVDVLGEEGYDIAESGDEVADADTRDRFIAAYEEKHKLNSGDSRATLIVGEEDFPFPIPIVKADDRWHFDTEAGVEEILDRRIGDNEIAAIETLRVYVDAQREYADVDRDGKGPQYARKLASSEGKTDGLYWPTKEGEAESPLGPLVADARAEGYRKRDDGPTPYHGFLFRILTAQGENAPGGAQDYILSGRMIGGFGMVAAPAEYGNSGVMTFVVDQDGNVYQSDLGDDTAEIAAEMTTFDPDETWTLVPADEEAGDSGATP